MSDAGQQELRTVYVPVDELVPYAGNAKEHPEWQVFEISESIKQFGFSDPIGAWHGPSGEAIIVEGHGRLLAAQELKIETVPVIWLDHLSDEERRAYGLVHNQLTMDTDFDAERLVAEVSAIVDVDMGVLGFDAPDVGDFGTDFSLPDRDEPDVSRASFTLAPEQKEAVMAALATVDTAGTETFGNADETGNALYQLVKEWHEGAAA